jgi:hypothetical protein
MYNGPKSDTPRPSTPLGKYIFPLRELAYSRSSFVLFYPLYPLTLYFSIYLSSFSSLVFLFMICFQLASANIQICICMQSWNS